MATTNSDTASPHWKRTRGPAEPPPSKSLFRTEAMGVFWAVMGTLLCLALASYDPADSSLNTVASGPVRNYVGIVGAYGADIFLQIFGYASYGISAFFFLTSYRAFRRKPMGWNWRYPPLLLAWIALLSCLFQWYGGHSVVAQGSQHTIGGFLGLVVAGQVHFWFGFHGGSVALWALFIVTCLRLFDVSLGAIFRAIRVVTRRAARKMAERLRLMLAVFAAKLKTRLKDFYKNSVAKVKGRDETALVPVVTQPLEFGVLRKGPRPPSHEKPTTSDYVDVTPLPPSEDPILAEAPTSLRPQRMTNEDGVTVTAPFADDAHYEMPSFDFLDDPEPAFDPAASREQYLENARRLTQKLAAFGIHGTVEAICPGPVITMYEFKPKEEVKISRIANLSDDLSLALSAESVRIIAPIPGKPVVGIEIPNENPESVRLKEVLRHTSFQDSKARIPIAFGKDIAGEPFVADLTSMPHLLVAGSTGAGKSVFINTVICGMLYRFTPSQVRMILIDPKMVELSVYDHIPHLLLPVVTDAQKASLALQWAVDEMERRYELMHDLQVRNIDSYNLKMQQGFEPTPSGLQHQHLPTIIIVVDELADLMMTSPKDVEISIARLAQKARAAGIHLILATQRPDTTVITGTIKANFSSRISFRVSSRIDSSTILDDKGAEKLLGKGDMLARLIGLPRITRLHGAYVSEREVERVVTHVRSQGEPTYDETILQPRDEGDTFVADEEMDEVYDRALEVVARERVASISLVQRRLRIGYNRAARIIELMERQGIIAPSDGTSRPRKVLAPPPPDH